MKQWARFAGIVLFWIAVIIFVTALLNFMGDCAPSTADCGEPERRLSFVMLAFGAIGLIYYAYIFVASRHRR